VRIRYAPSKEKVEKMLSRYFRNLKDRFDLKLGVLFGSYAKNSYCWGSDVDLLIVASDLPENLAERFAVLVDSKLPIQIQPFGYTTVEFEKMLKGKNSLLTEALLNGKIIYTTRDYRSLVEDYCERLRANRLGRVA
jgi:predicted nucleotidyltransferase